jgi:hypothetical protein
MTAKLSKRKLVALANLSPSAMSGGCRWYGKGQQAFLTSLQLKVNLDVEALEDVCKQVLAACCSLLLRLR